ncbi:endonuclease [Xylanibacillus composti]|uniref:Endonuclease n=1 Tax=Xylanibacillus composti TaxID=1572762 RepID=A0A8J4M0F0_9BACL|nr:endonuclease [Xylanibacillus composti]
MLLAAKQDPVPWNVMTYNIRHAKGTDDITSIRRIAQVIRQEQANIVALQEVDSYLWRSGFQNQVEELARELGMNWAFAPSLKLGRFAYGNAILSHYPIVSATSLSLGGLRENRILLKAVVATDWGEIEVFTTHLGLSEKERERQMPLLLRHLERAQEPAFLLGDFNMEAAHPLLQLLPERWNKLEQTEKRGTIMGNREIDHIYAVWPEAAAMRVQEVYVPVTIASDHLPVVARFISEAAVD